MVATGRPARRRNIILVVAALAWPVLAVVAWLDPVVFTADWPVWLQVAGAIVLGLGVLNAAILGPVFVLMSHVDARALGRLRRGEGVVARWQVTPEGWRSFLASDERLGGANLLNRGMECPPEGLACIANREAVLIGGDFHNLAGPSLISRVSWRDAAPGLLEVVLGTPRGRSGGLSYSMLRFPVGPDFKAGRDLHAAWLYRAGLIGNSGASGNALKRRNMALVALLLGVLLAAVPMAMHGPEAALTSNDTGPEGYVFIRAEPSAVGAKSRRGRLNSILVNSTIALQHQGFPPPSRACTDRQGRLDRPR